MPKNVYDTANDKPLTVSTALQNTFPIWGTVVLLVITRVQQIGASIPLQSTDSPLILRLGTFGKNK